MFIGEEREGSTENAVPVACGASFRLQQERSLQSSATYLLQGFEDKNPDGFHNVLMYRGALKGGPQVV